MTLQNSMDVPIFVIDPSRAFGEVPSAPQNTTDATRPVSSLVIFVAYLLSGAARNGALAETPIEQIHREIQNACDKYNVDIDRVFMWAQNLLLDCNDTFTEEERKLYIPRRIESKGWDLRDYQWIKAAWSAYRSGSILALGCGVGKSGTSTAAAIGAANAGRCQKTRCHILAPVNAMPQWAPYCDELRKTFAEVKVYSIDSAHNLLGMDRSLGGAIIYDELHKLKSDNSRRGDACEELRNAYEWSVGLTGTLFHAGAEGVLRVQDMVLPGLSRFLNKWAFGDAFNCIYAKKIPSKNGNRTRRSLAMPSDENFEAFTNYMARGVASLSFDSPEVKDVVTMPGRNTILVDSWAMPHWAREMQVQLSKADSRNQVYWAPDWLSDGDTARYLGAVALAEAENEPNRALPSFAKVMQMVCKEGRVNRVITKVHIPGVKDAQFRWVYEPGWAGDDRDPDTMPPGPKIAQVEEWLKENPKEPAILASVGNLGMYMLAKLLVKLGISFEIIRGGVDVDERDRIVKEFEAGKFQICLIQQAAGAESITLVRATTSILIDHSWSSAIYTQFMARNYRIGQTEYCEHYDYVFGNMQAIAVRRLKRGEMFDQRVRNQIESKFWDQNLVQTMAVSEQQ